MVHGEAKDGTVRTRDHLSATVFSFSGVRMTVEHPIEDEVTQLQRRVEQARGRLAFQFDPALTEVLSEEELRAERELAERIRVQDRGQRWKEIQAAAAASDRARQTTEEIEKADMRDLLLARKAIANQRRESSPHAKLASLYRHRSWSLKALAGVVGSGMLWSAVNVQQNIAPTGKTDPLFWFSYLLEGMISACLIIIMIGSNKVAEWGVIDNRRQVAVAEMALLSLTVSLNTYPYIRTGSWYDAAVHAVAPVMIGVALLIHDAVSSRYGMAIARATEQVRDIPEPTDNIRRHLPRSEMSMGSAAEAAQGMGPAPTTPAPDKPIPDKAPPERPRPTRNGKATGNKAARSARSDRSTATTDSLGSLDELTNMTKGEVSNGSGKAGSPPANGSSGSGKNGERMTIDEEAASYLEAIRSTDAYDTGQFRVADILEQELAELQAERRRARSNRQRSAASGG